MHHHTGWSILNRTAVWKSPFEPVFAIESCACDIVCVVWAVDAAGMGVVTR